MGKRLGFTYIFCSDLEKMKWFYTDILHLNLIWENNHSIAYMIGQHQFSIHLFKNVPLISEEYSIQPGWEGGKVPRTSWSLECDMKNFEEIVQASKENKIRTFFNEPKWIGYWSYPMLDPMNNTIEITCTER
ncbi:hypothetical protein QA612_13865 [Evansella sp. AB-P1]|uniref:VOC family protein n=1 Tax=Evansella sp. AB-P1 TaxID=3037653 RepID=UPI00241C14DC|nr:hypothetical protein [Evansella sp. AB-P1]MDG5788568.1 hypothetical protein [Evansella sp. AB-P1]